MQRPLDSSDFKVKAVHISKEKEWGLFASCDVEKDSVLFQETPWIASQYLYNGAFFKCCEHCKKSLESPDAMLQRLSGTARVDLPFLDEFASADGVQLDPQTGDNLCCQHCHKVWFCSRKCMQESFSEYHAKMCPGTVTDKQKLVALERLETIWKSFHYPPEAATPMLIVKAVNKVLSDLDSGNSFEDSTAPIYAFKNDVRDASNELHSRFLEPEFADRIDALYSAFVVAIGDDRVPDLVSESGFRSLLSAMHLNAQGYGTSALEAYREFLEEKDTLEAKLALETIESMADDIEQVSGQFTVAEGSGLYQVHHYLNHSCAPNARVFFLENSAKLSLVAIKHIQAGDEVTISYAPFGYDVSDSCCSCDSNSDEADYESRQRYLQEHYQFKCQCSLCRQEQLI